MIWGHVPPWPQHRTATARNCRAVVQHFLACGVWSLLTATEVAEHAEHV